MDIWTKEDFDQTIEAIKDKVQQTRNYEGDINAPRIHILHQEIKAHYQWMLYEQLDLKRLLNEMNDWFGPGKIDFQDESTPERKRWNLIQYKLGVIREDILPLVRPTVSFLDKYLAPERSSRVEVAKSRDEPQQFTTKLNQTQADTLFELLIDKGYISSNTDKPSFLWVFGGENFPNSFAPVEWIKPVSTVRDSISKRTLFNLLHELDISRNDIVDNRRYRFCFRCNGKPLKMSSNNISQAEENGWKSEHHEEIMRIIASL